MSESGDTKDPIDHPKVEVVNKRTESGVEHIEVNFSGSEQSFRRVVSPEYDIVGEVMVLNGVARARITPAVY